MAGILWLLSAAVVLLAALLPGGLSENFGVMAAVGIYAIVFGVGSVTDRLGWSHAPLWKHVLRFVVTAPVLAAVQWATGGGSSFALPLMSLALFFAAYFYPPRIAWPLVALMIGVLAAPFAYDAHAVAEGFASRFAAFAVAGATLTGVVLHLKGRLVRAELEQRRMAFGDPLTGAGNRRAFDCALDAAVAQSAGSPCPAAVLFLDLDRFKQVNDVFGHEAGDRALCAVADHCRGAMRPSDTLARIGGDEFAVVAPHAGEDGAVRLASLLGEAVQHAAPAEGAEPLRATVSWALLGRDGDNGAELMRTADRRLHAAKRVRHGSVAGL
jgi:diguanylate cyclase (GGDEF)-like protein